jgi:hypothetical protein
LQVLTEHLMSLAPTRSACGTLNRRRSRRGAKTPGNRAPDRVPSLTSVSFTTNDPALPLGAPAPVHAPLEPSLSVPRTAQGPVEGRAHIASMVVGAVDESARLALSTHTRADPETRTRPAPASEVKVDRTEGDVARARGTVVKQGRDVLPDQIGMKDLSIPEGPRRRLLKPKQPTGVDGQPVGITRKGCQSTCTAPRLGCSHNKPSARLGR